MKKNILATTFTLALFTQNSSALTLNSTKVDFKNLSDNSNKESRSLKYENETIIVKFDAPLNSSVKNRFYKSGVETIVYAGDFSYYFYAKKSILNKLNFQNIGFIEKAQMQSKYRYSSNGLITLGHSAYQKFNILFLREMSKSQIQSYLDENGINATVLKAIPSLREAKVEVSTADLPKLKELHLIQYMDTIKNMITVNGEKTNRNLSTAKNSNISDLWSGKYNLNGENMKIGIVDGGIVRSTHQEFNVNGISRIFNKSNVDVNFHATHVAGTIIAEGDKKSARGMANRAKLFSYGFGDVAFSESVMELYKNDGVLLSNHSYGYSDKTELGEYDSAAASQDKAVENNPFLNIIQASGNDGDSANYSDFGIIKGPGNSKNILTIGALNINSTGVADISSTGPVRDGRIKPDLCIRGEYIQSSTDEGDDSYAIMSGTSMATPAATGSAALISQQYKRSTGGYDIRHDTLKSIMINTAIDKENKGPDYKVGFGMINAKAAVDVVLTIETDNPLMQLGSISHGREYVYNFTQSKNLKFKTTISWVDKSANPASDATLVNDIDIILVNNTTGKKYYPYTLDKLNPNALAVANKENRVDNIEQIEIDNLEKGSYKLIVKGAKIISDIQEFTIVANNSIFNSGNIQTLKPSNLISFAKTIHSSIL